MPSSLPPLPSEISDSPSASPQGSAGPSSPSAFSGGMPSMMAALQQIETGLKTLATSVPSLLPMCAQMISQLRQTVPAATGADAGASGPGAMPPPGPGGTSPAMTGNSQNPQTLPAPPQGA